MKKIAVLLMVLTIGSKFLGFIRDITLSYFYGASSISDAYLVSQLIPMSILEFIGLGLLTGYIPIYNTIQNENGGTESNDFTNNVINLVVIISTLLIFVGFFFTEDIVKVFAMGFKGETLNLAVRFTKISLFGIYSVLLGYVFKGFLQIKDSYVIPAITGFSLNIIIILSIFLSSNSNVDLLAYGSLLAVISQLVILIPYAYKKGFRYKVILDIKNDHIKNLWYLAIPMIMGISVNQINVLVDRTLASRIVEGGISALNYANRLNLFVQGIFVLSISTVMYPMISKMASERNLSGLKKSLGEAIGSINILIIPTTIGAIVFANPIISLLFGRGAFDKEAIKLTSGALVFYSIGMIGFGLREVISRAFYSMQDTRTPMINAVIGLVLNIVLNLVLSRYMGISGLALATSIAALFTTGLLFVSLRKKIGQFGMKQIVNSFIKITFSSLLMGIIAKLCFHYLTLALNQNISLLIAVMLGIAVYFGTILFMKIEDVDIIIAILKRKFIKSAF